MKGRVIVITLAVVALAAKIYCAAKTIGTSDVVLFYDFAKVIHEHGLLAMYRANTLFNHTPLVGWFSEAIYVIAHGERPRFAFYLRLPAIFADLLGVIVLLAFREKLRRPSWWALAVYAASPVAFMVSGYHGNVDSIMALGVLLASIACALNSPGLCGLFLGLACNVKIAPLILAPAFFFAWRERDYVLRFSAVAALVMLAGWVYPLVTIPTVFLQAVFNYGSAWGVWGLSYFLRLTGYREWSEVTLGEMTPAQSAVMTGLKVFIVVSAILVAWRRRRVTRTEIFRTLAFTWAIFFVFAPGFAAQYLAWIIPCFLLADERWFAAVIASSSIALFVFYNSISHGMPWRQGFTVHSLASQWAPALILPWLVLAAFFGSNLRTMLLAQANPETVEDSPSAAV